MWQKKQVHHNIPNPSLPPLSRRVVSYICIQSPNFRAFKEPKNRLQRINSASLFNLAGRYDNSIPTRFLAPIDYLQISALDAVQDRELATNHSPCTT